MSLSERNPYEVHAELVQRIERLEVELTHRVGWQERCERAEAEIERLRKDAEIWRLRDALMQIWHLYPKSSQAATIADAALHSSHD